MDGCMESCCLILCAACSWAGNNMGWAALLGGSVVASIGAGAGAKLTAVPLVVRSDWVMRAAGTAISFPKATFPCNIPSYFPIRARRRRPIPLIPSIRP